MSSIPSRLAVLPLSRFDATRVALLMRSGKLVKLPRTSASLTAFMFSGGGRLVEPPASGDVTGSGVPCCKAPPFCRPPIISRTRGSTAGDGCAFGFELFDKLLISVPVRSDETFEEEGSKSAVPPLKLLVGLMMSSLGFGELRPAANAPAVAPTMTSPPSPLDSRTLFDLGTLTLLSPRP